MAADIAETSQVYAHCCARIQPEWLMGINDPLFKRNYSEPPLATKNRQGDGL